MPESYYREQEIQYMIDEFGVPVTIGAVTAKGIVNRTDREMMEAGFPEMIGKGILIEVKTSSGGVPTFPSLVVGVDVVFAGVTYKAAKILQRGDGATLQIFCAKE